MFRKLNKNKAAGPDHLTPAILSHCSDQLAPVFADIYNSSLSQQKVPAPFKNSTIIPIHKTAKISDLNDYRPVALTSVTMKAFERIILEHLKSVTSPLMDPYQFAYRPNRSTDDAVNLALHFTLQHLESKHTYVRILFIDFSSAFNTIDPLKLFRKLQDMNINTSLCLWILDFLKDRTQVVRFNNITSHPLTTSIGVPQGCVLSPLLFSLFTNNFRSTSNSIKTLKYADDTTIVGLITKDNEDAYRLEVEKSVNWCRKNDLVLNERKTIELIIDFRTKQSVKAPILIDSQPITITDSFKFLGTHISNNLKWDLNANHHMKKAQQRLYFMRQLKKTQNQEESTGSILHSHNPKHPVIINYCLVWKLI